MGTKISAFEGAVSGVYLRENSLRRETYPKGSLLFFRCLLLKDSADFMICIHLLPFES